MSYFTRYQGNTVPLNVAATLNSAPLDLAGCTLYFKLYRYVDDAAPLFLAQTGSGITHTAPASGQAAIDMPKTATASLPTGLALPYFLQAQTASNEFFTVDAGHIEFTASPLNT